MGERIGHGGNRFVINDGQTNGLNLKHQNYADIFLRFNSILLFLPLIKFSQCGKTLHHIIYGLVWLHFTSKCSYNMI